MEDTQTRYEERLKTRDEASLKAGLTLWECRYAELASGSKTDKHVSLARGLYAALIAKRKALLRTRASAG